VAVTTAPARQSWLGTLNAEKHHVALVVFTGVVVAHWLEHVVQAIQVFGYGTARPQARGVLGTAFPWLVSSEALHFGYALFMLAGLALLRDGFVGRARQWWNLALAIQCWHFIEHLLLLFQAQSGWHLAGEPVPTSVLQLVVARVELHLFYNAVVFVPMVVALVLHRRANADDRARMQCDCARPAMRSA
jgi:hypothetical protein